MSKKQLTGILVALILVGVLFSLPKVVVESEAKKEAAVAEGTATVNAAGPASEEAHDPNHEGHDHEHEEGMHVGAMGAEQLQSVESLREKISKSGNIEKVAIFADSLAALYANSFIFDSAAYYAELALSKEKSLPRVYKAGLYNFEAFNYSVEAGRQQAFAKKAEDYLSQVLKENPERLDAKNKLAMLKVSSQSPMEGIFMLREVLEKDPDNAEALMNMGMLSVQSSQFDKAVGHLERLTKLKPEHVQAQFYLAVSYFQLGRKQEAKQGFLKVKELDKSADVAATVDEYLKNL
ncbi:tetratricopeptide repeat protein [Nafulsella turpanensis]|uniref:tetratricopeptide repeat protein n=1 Tax=Nafulsella turpanensis TaxID=1265690 RepID=UPI00034CED51|nr:tetratricopeptide repeat protein [Nafulsella turpanensis]